MNRGSQVALAIGLVLILVAVVYAVDPQLLGKGSVSNENAGGSVTFSETAAISASTQGGQGQSAAVSVGATMTASTSSSTTDPGMG